MKLKIKRIDKGSGVATRRTPSIKAITSKAVTTKAVAIKAVFPNMYIKYSFVFQV
jgi:hypothetical protein